jgi:hypothetical protein
MDPGANWSIRIIHDQAIGNCSDRKITPTQSRGYIVTLTGILFGY